MTYCGTPIKTYVMSLGDNGQLSIISLCHRQNLTPVKGAVLRNSAKLGHYKMPVKLRET